MPISDSYLTFLVDQLTDWADVVIRKMFGGAGLYREGIMFALVAEDVLYLRTGEANREDFEARDCGPFKPYADKDTVMPYHRVPEDLLEDSQELAAWAEAAWQVARTAKKRR